MRQRSNDEWLSELRDDEQREQALADLRSILLRGLQHGLVNQVNTTAPEFQPLAEDFVQDALLKILANLDTFRGQSKFTTWAHKIAVRNALTELRRKRWKNRSLDAMLSEDTPYTFSVEDIRPKPEELAEQSEVVNQVFRIIDEELTDKQRQAMVLIPIQGVPIDVAAKEMNMKRNAVYKLMHDARLRLKKRLEAEGLSPESILATFD